MDSDENDSDEVPALPSLEDTRVVTTRRRAFLGMIGAAAAGAGATTLAGKTLARPNARPFLTTRQVHGHADGVMVMLRSLIPDVIDAVQSPADAARDELLARITEKQEAILFTLTALDPAVTTRVVAKCEGLSVRGDDEIRQMIHNQRGPGHAAIPPQAEAILIDSIKRYFAAVPQIASSLAPLSH